MREEPRHECGVAALYGLREGSPQDVAARLPSMLLDLQNRGQLAAGISSYQPGRAQIIDTFKDVGTVTEAFRMSHPAEHVRIMADYSGRAAIGHTRYATCGQDDARYAQPFERHHGRLWKWFAFAFNGNLANYTDLRDQLLARHHYHFTLDTDTEMIMHALAYRLRGDQPVDLLDVMASVSQDFDGAYNIAFLDAMGRMFVARDPLGFRPMSWGLCDGMFGAASESAALANQGFQDIRPLEPGHMVIIEDGRLRLEQFASRPTKARCFFEMVYFSNVASTIDGASVYLARAESGRRLAELEDQPLDNSCVAVAVPDTAKAAADAFAYALRLPSMEGLIRNRYVGRTFIQPSTVRGDRASSKYTPLLSVLEGKRVFLIEDSIVRATTLRALTRQLRQRGGARQVHVRVACPPIVAPCFYGIDMSTLGELFAPRFAPDDYTGTPDEAMLRAMAHELGLDSLRYLTVGDLGPCLGLEQGSLCLGCVTASYPTQWGCRLMEQARRNLGEGEGGRTYE